MLRIASWNVNSVRSRMDLLSKLADSEQPDIICLQEVKAKAEDFPADDIRRLGYNHIALYSMPAYNGVAVLSRTDLREVEQFIRNGKDDARHIKAVTIHNLEIHNLYIPAGGDVPDCQSNPSFAHKLAFVDEIKDFFARHRHQRLLVCGDFNIAPGVDDVWNHRAMLKTISHTPPETSRLSDFFKQGEFADAVRHIFPEPQKVYSWWSYRNPNWQINNKGRRLDHIWVSKDILPAVKNIKIGREFRCMERPSDHVPILVDLDI